MSGVAPLSMDASGVQVQELSMLIPALDLKSGLKRKRNPILATPAWSYCEALFGTMLPMIRKFVVYVCELWLLELFSYLIM